jgi:hypothetical protein
MARRGEGEAWRLRHSICMAIFARVSAVSGYEMHLEHRQFAIVSVSSGKVEETRWGVQVLSTARQSAHNLLKDKQEALSRSSGKLSHR